MKSLSTAALTLLLALALGSDAWAQAWSTYNSGRNPKNQGVSLSVDYPGGYQPGEDSGNSIMAYFAYTDEADMVAKILQVTVIGDPDAIPDPRDRKAFEGSGVHDLCSLSDAETRAIISMQRQPGVSISPTSGKKTVNGVCGRSYTATISFSQQGVPLFTALDAFMVGYMNRTVREPRYVLLSCNTTGLMSDKANIQRVHQKDSPALCERYFNSLAIHDR
jgi:hypothetical protein